jgi:hypothetical protein
LVRTNDDFPEMCGMAGFLTVSGRRGRMPRR